MSNEFENYSHASLIELLELRAQKITALNQQLDDILQLSSSTTNELREAQREISHYWYIMGKLGRVLEVDIPDGAQNVPNNIAWLKYADAVVEKAATLQGPQLDI